VIALVGGSPGAQGASQSYVITLASFGGSLEAVAQDGPRVAWLHGGPHTDCDNITVENVVTGRRSTIEQDPSSRGYGFCANMTLGGGLVLAGTRALVSAQAAGNSEYVTLWYGTVSHPAGRVIFNGSYTDYDGGEKYRGMIGDGPTLVYAVEKWTNRTRNVSPLQRIDQHGVATDVPGVEAGLQVAASGAFLATRVGGHVVVLNARTGRRVGSARVSSTRGALSLGPRLIAVSAGSVVEVYDWRTHQLVQRTRLDRAPLMVWLTGGRLAYRVDKDVWLMDLATRSQRVVATLKPDVFGVSVKNERLVWGENDYKENEFGGLVAKRGYVRMLRLW
jgi:hypothetical protein